MFGRKIPERYWRSEIPYIQLHEFEALLFSEIEAFENIFPGTTDLITNLQAIKNQFQSPEHINENPDRSPSARILNIIPSYVKPVSAILIVQKIGLNTVRRECAHFGEWINRLEQLEPNTENTP